MAGNTSVPGQTVSSRLLAVLDCFDVDHRELTLTEIAQRTGLALSTARRLIGELTEWGGLERLPSGGYRVGVRLWQVGSLAPQARDLREAALPYMHDLFEATRENVQLAVPDGVEALCIEKVSGSKAVPTFTHVGGRLPLHTTGVGKAVLAFSSRDLLQDIVSRGLARHTIHSIVEPGRLATALDGVRRTGLAYSYEEMSLGAISVASPIVAAGRLCGALGIVTHSSTPLERLAPAVRTAALGVSRSIG
ncbi:IclR family transcriptional regulator [Mycolicibacterium sp.]|uniref:IclR family transcriptional regulator n=1 Tax=Mycolicibacterium sp. TaxID=2320850 RepID=UPI003D0E6810